MAKQQFVVGEGGEEWATSYLGVPAETGKDYEFELTAEQETALVAAGWLTPSEKKKGGKG